MKTPMQQLIDEISAKIQENPNSELSMGLQEALIIAYKKVDVEKNVIKIAYDVGLNDYANFHYFAENSEDYYNKAFTK
jgi:hypothetical protein